MTLQSTSCSLRVLFAVAICSLGVPACLNPIGQYYMSEPISLDGVAGAEIVKVLSSHRDRAYWKATLDQLLDRRRNRSVAYEAINHAVALAHLGDVKEAIAILQTVERKNPGEYATAANLGTVYELNGENEKALKWIKEGTKRNKHGHSGSEWLHVKILETKLRLKEEPNWLNSNTVLNIRFDQETDPANFYTTDHLGQRRSLEEIESALVYQLHERLEFIKPPEPIVADLLTDLSSIFAITRGAEDASAVYDLAKSYGTTRPVYLKPRAIMTNEPPAIVTDAPAPESWSAQTMVLVAAFVLALLAGLVVILRYFLRST